MFKRIWFFLLTNIAVLALFAVVMSIVQVFLPKEFQTIAWGYPYWMLYALIFGMLGSFFSLFISKWSAKKAYDIQILDENSASSDPKLLLIYKTTERIARENNIKMPEVGYYESTDVNAFATGTSKNNSLVAFSTALLNQMNEDEIEGVVGHEMAHILNGDMVTLTLIQGVMNAFVIFLAKIVAEAIDKFLSSDDGEGLGLIAYNLVYIGLQIVFGFLASFVVMYFSRKREYRADEGGAKYTSKAKMIAGLQKLKSMQSLGTKDTKMSPFMITEPDSMFSTHPSLDNRIKALQENFSIR